MIKPKPFKAVGLMKELMDKYYLEGEMSQKKGIPVAWVTAVFPVEIIYAAGLFPYYPENFGAIAGARKVADKLSMVAEAKGYTHDLCGYARCGIGDAYADEHPVGKIIKPDLLFCCNTQCGSLPKWFEVAGRFYDAPFFLLDAPQIDDEIDELCERYFTLQLKELISFLEEFTGRPFDYDRLKEVLRLSGEACRLWNEVLDSAALSPAPFNYFDACIHMAPIVTWRGTEEAVTYYRVLKEEINERIKEGISAIPDEHYKIYFDHIPLWPKLRWFSSYFAQHKALVAVSQYTHSWAYSFDLNRPIESLVENYAGEYVNHCFDYRVQLKIDFMKKYGCDGFVLFSNRSCKPNALGLYDKRKIISEATGLPGVVFEADMSDLRFFSESQVRAELDPFFEQLSFG
ncbi:MAG: 2-hydroxyacyl-CoA dehydratase [Firmicutes bacterium]|nr:2-hydroxyacyl-CoA dehydratase [Bacillota bacterium]